MWIAFIAAHPGDFQESEKPSAIRQLAAKHIRAMPPEERKEAIAAILKEIPHPRILHGLAQVAQEPDRLTLTS
jgi:hypothetical protein